MIKHIVPTLLLPILLAGCAGSCGKADSPPRMSAAAVIGIANAEARRNGVDLSRVLAPEAHFEYVRKDCTWSVFYEGQGATIGNHFLVVVDDVSGSADFHPGMAEKEEMLYARILWTTRPTNDGPETEAFLLPSIALLSRRA